MGGRGVEWGWGLKLLVGLGRLYDIWRKYKELLLEMCDMWKAGNCIAIMEWWLCVKDGCIVQYGKFRIPARSMFIMQYVMYKSTLANIPTLLGKPCMIKRPSARCVCKKTRLS